MRGGGLKLLEIAPGRGDLLSALAPHCQEIYTIDPSNISLEIENLDKHKHIQGFFDKNTKEILNQKANLIIFRHLLEHVENAGEFLRDIVQIARDEALIYIEVPNSPEFLEHLRFYEFFNDHCGYHQKAVLDNFMTKLGCKCVGELLLYNDQHLGLFFQKSVKTFKKSEIKPIFYNKSLKIKLQERIIKCNKLLQDFENIGIYGAGAHGNSIICFLEPLILQKCQICFDLDSKKQGKYLQNSNIIIKKPDKSQFTELDCIIIASPLYEQEVLEFLTTEGFKGFVLISEKELKLVQI